MPLEKFLGTWTVKDSETTHEADGHSVTISVVVRCRESGGGYPRMVYHEGDAEQPERLEGTYCDGHKVTITRRDDDKGIRCEVGGKFPDTGSWTADDPGAGGGGG